MKIYIKRLLKVLPILALGALTPLTTFAAFNYCDPRGGLYNVLCKIHDLLSTVLPVLVALGVVYFVWGVVTYFIANEEQAKSAGKERIIFGIIGLAVIISVWGLVYLITDTFGTRLDAPPSDQYKKLLPPKS